MLQEQDKRAMRGPPWEVTKGHREEKTCVIHMSAAIPSLFFRLHNLSSASPPLPQKCLLEDLYYFSVASIAITQLSE